jgi:hypothetical protein
MLKNILILSILILTAACFNTYSQNLKVIEEKTFQIQPGKNLKVDASGGGVTITSWDKNEVNIKILGNEKAKDKMKFEFKNDDDKVEVIAKRKHWLTGWFSNGIKLRIEITVPKKFNTKVETGGGSISILDVSGNINLSTSGGGITFKDVNGKFNVSTSGGSITGINFNGDLDAETSGGGIRLSGRDSKIKAETSGGSISLDYEGVNKGIYLSTSGGSIHINLPEDFNASAKLYTSGGGISCNLKANNVKKISSTEFVADLNKGGNRLYAETSGGSITVSKK